MDQFKKNYKKFRLSIMNKMTLIKKKKIKRFPMWMRKKKKSHLMNNLSNKKRKLLITFLNKKKSKHQQRKQNKSKSLLFQFSMQLMFGYRIRGLQSTLWCLLSSNLWKVNLNSVRLATILSDCLDKAKIGKNQTSYK